MFWLNLASCHYARQTRKRLQIKKISCVPKEDTPRNVPRAKSIEELWALLYIVLYITNYHVTENINKNI